MHSSNETDTCFWPQYMLQKAACPLARSEVRLGQGGQEQDESGYHRVGRGGKGLNVKTSTFTITQSDHI